MTFQKIDVSLLETTTKQHGDELVRLKRELRAGLVRLKSEVRAGLMSLGESIDELKQVMEARCQLMERQLRQEMSAYYAKLVDLH